MTAHQYCGPISLCVPSLVFLSCLALELLSVKCRIWKHLCIYGWMLFFEATLCKFLEAPNSTAITLFSLMWVWSCAQMPTNGHNRFQHNMKKHESICTCIQQKVLGASRCSRKLIKSCFRKATGSSVGRDIHISEHSCFQIYFQHTISPEPNKRETQWDGLMEGHIHFHIFLTSISDYTT